MKITKFTFVPIACALGLGLSAQAAAQAILEEITVTARKREERLIDTPVAVAVMTSEELDRYNTRDLKKPELVETAPGRFCRCHLVETATVATDGGKD